MEDDSHVIRISPCDRLEEPGLHRVSRRDSTIPVSEPPTSRADRHPDTRYLQVKQRGGGVRTEELTVNYDRERSAATREAIRTTSLDRCIDYHHRNHDPRPDQGGRGSGRYFDHDGIRDRSLGWQPAVNWAATESGSASSIPSETMGQGIVIPRISNASQGLSRI
jgi:hypothetical protein